MLTIKEGKKAETLLVLYNNAKKQGLGLLNYKSSELTIDNTKKLLCDETYFDYLNGKVLKIDLETNELDPTLYDRDNGNGLCERVLKKRNLLIED